MTKIKKVFKIQMEDKLNEVEVDSRSDYVDGNVSLDWDLDMVNEDDIREVIAAGGYKVVGKG